MYTIDIPRTAILPIPEIPGLSLKAKAPKPQRVVKVDAVMALPVVLKLF